MNMDRRTFLAIFGAALTSGCAFRKDSPFVSDKGIIRKGEKPVSTSPDEFLREEKHEYPESWEEISDIPVKEKGYPRPNIGAAPVSPINKNTIKKIEEELAYTGKTLFINSKPLTIQMGDKYGREKIYTIPPGYIFLCDKSADANGDEILVPRRLARCWNPVSRIQLRRIPRTIVITRYYVRKERYEDEHAYVDYGPGLLIGGLIGLLAGGIIGWILHPSAGGSVCAPVVSKGPIPCPPGAPVPRP